MKSSKVVIRRNKEASITRIINATAELFTEKSYDEITYTEIANKANLNISLISRYFGTKAKLLQAVVNVMSSQSKLSFDTIPQQNTFKDELHLMSDVIVDNILEHQVEVKAIVNIAMHDKKFCKGLYQVTEANIEVENRLKRFYDAGDIHKSHNLRYAVDTFISLINSNVLFLELSFGLPNKNVRDRVHYIVEMFAEGLTKENISTYPTTFNCEKE